MSILPRQSDSIEGARLIVMKRMIFFLLWIVPTLALSLSVGLAQETAGQLESLQISIWPDFDQPSVLVLMTGQLPEGITLPVEVSIPIPENAEINAVAQVDDSGMISLEYEAAKNTVTFATMNPRFRVEYYAPYQQDGGQRSYNFDWRSDLSVNEFAVEIQQPASATTLSSEPGATDVYTNQIDGLVYHDFDSQAVPSGTPYRLNFSYEMASDGLTVGPAVSVPETFGGQTTTIAAEGDNNLILLGGALGLIALAIAGTWLVATRRSGRKSSRPPKPKPKARSKKGKAVIYCHVCGQPAEGDDRFCRQCGTELKRL